MWITTGLLLGSIAFAKVSVQLCFVLLATAASVECWRQLCLEKNEKKLHEELVLASAGLCETCPYVFMVKHSIVLSEVPVLGGYKKGGQRSNA